MANVLRLPQLTRLISSKPCSKLDPSPGFRHFRHVGFGCVWRDQARNVCLMARSSVNIVGGRDSSGGHRRFGTEKRYSASEMTSGNEEIGEPELQDSHSKHKNLENVKNEFLKNQLKEIQDQLRDNNNEIKKLKETAQGSWDLLRKIVFPVKPSVQKATMDLIAVLLNAQGHKVLERNEHDVHNENPNAPTPAPTAEPREKLLTPNAQEHQELERSEHDENPLSGNDHPKEGIVLNVPRESRANNEDLY